MGAPRARGGLARPTVFEGPERYPDRSGIAWAEGLALVGKPLGTVPDAAQLPRYRVERTSGGHPLRRAGTSGASAALARAPPALARATPAKRLPPPGHAAGQRLVARICSTVAETVGACRQACGSTGGPVAGASRAPRDPLPLHSYLPNCE